LRIRLIERLCRLPAAGLSEVDSCFARLEKLSGLSGPKSPQIAFTPHKNWPHAPLHRLSEHGTFMVTASTLHKEHFFRGAERLTLLHDALLQHARQYELILEAWAVFSTLLANPHPGFGGDLG